MIKEILLEDIVANMNQPRKHFDEESLNELAASIIADGLQEPILVRPVDDKYEIVQGERRFRAHRLAGLTTIQVKVRELTDEEAFHLAVIENIQREQLTAIEEANAFYRYVEMGYTHEEIAKKVSKNREYVTSKLRLLKLEPQIQHMISCGKISDGHAKQILKLEKPMSRLWKDQSLFTSESPFQTVQRKFFDAFWDADKVSVMEVKKWSEKLIYDMILYTVLHLTGKGDTIIGRSHLREISAEQYCNMYNLHPRNLVEEDIDFALAYEKELYASHFDRNFRPWQLEQHWDRVKDLLFYSEVGIETMWIEPQSGLEGKTLQDIAAEIGSYQAELRKAVLVLVWLKHEFAIKNGKVKPSKEQIVSFLALNLGESNAVTPDLANSLYEEFVEGQDLTVLFKEAQEEIDKIEKKFEIVQ